MNNENLQILKKSLICPTTGYLSTFAYASLIWRPDFEYDNKTIGYIKGYKRRFYQGSVTHRGTKEWPGRVATIIKDDNSVVWGVSYETRSEKSIEQALDKLYDREIKNGGYCHDRVLFYPYGKEDEPYFINVYVAENDNSLYMGSGGSLEIQAYQIVKAEGFCGRNVDYVTKVADFMETEINKNWKDLDPYLYQLCSLIKSYENSTIDSHVNELDLLSMQKSENDDHIRKR